MSTGSFLQRAVKVAAVAWLVVIVTGVVSQSYVRATLLVADVAAHTATDIAGHVQACASTHHHTTWRSSDRSDVSRLGRTVVSAGERVAWNAFAHALACARHNEDSKRGLVP